MVYPGALEHPASMGPRSNNRGYARNFPKPSHSHGASMGPRSNNRGYGRSEAGDGRANRASMGPRSNNRGYVVEPVRRGRNPQLQWVHGRITVVMWAAAKYPGGGTPELQWVHGRITVVMSEIRLPGSRPGYASMGPRSNNRGYAGAAARARRETPASMGPRSNNRGYGSSF